MGSITSYSKQIVVFFLALSLFIRPTFASSVGGWSMGNPVAQGASTIYEGSKNVIINGADYVKKGTAKITPNAANVAKTLGKGVAGVAVSVVVDELVGAVDWVLDPENNRIKYYDPADPNSIPNAPTNKIWTHQCGHPAKKLESYSLNAMAPFLLQCQWDNTSISQKLVSVNTKTGDICVENVRTHGTYYGCTSIKTRAITVNDPPREQDRPEKSIPLETVAQTVISNAESNTDKRAAAQAVTTAAAADIVAEAETDSVKARPIAQQLEATSTTKPADEAVAAQANTATGTQTQNPTKPETSDLALEFPAFCGWAPTVCEFAQTAIQSIADAKAEYADKPQENTDTELEIPDLEQDIEVDTDISFGGSCPAPLTSQVNFMGINETIEFSFENVCEIAEFIKPVVISVSAFSAALIVAGIRTEDD